MTSSCTFDTTKGLDPVAVIQCMQNVLICDVWETWGADLSKIPGLQRPKC